MIPEQVVPGSLKHMILYIDTTKEKELVVGLYAPSGEKLSEQKKPIDKNESENLLKTIADLLGDAREKLQGIIVVKGPEGRFSAIRTGVTAANALAWAGNLPVIGIEQEEPIEVALGQISKKDSFTDPVHPTYATEPNIG